MKLEVGHYRYSFASAQKEGCYGRCETSEYQSYRVQGKVMRMALCLRKWMTGSLELGFLGKSSGESGGERIGVGQEHSVKKLYEVPVLP